VSLVLLLDYVSKNIAVEYTETVFPLSPTKTSFSHLNYMLITGCFPKVNFETDRSMCLTSTTDYRLFVSSSRLKYANGIGA